MTKDFNEKEANLNKSIDQFLVSRYGHLGDPPQIKIEPDELVQKVGKTKKRIDDGKVKDTEEDYSEEPILTKKDI